MKRTAETHPLTFRIDDNQQPLALDIESYEKRGGYEAVRNMIKTMSPQEVQDRVKESDLRGRGGAGFPTGMKWSFVPMGDDARKPKYLVVNADEMEPGTFKDRLLMEADPHSVIEGVICAAYAIQAETSYIFLRWAYKESEARLRKALEEAYAKGYLGSSVCGSGYSLDCYLHMSAGRYICGEETALLNSLEGKRANPRAKPPFPQILGLFGQPTIVQNVETLCNVPHIIRHGGDWFKGLSNGHEAGTKLYGASGRVNTPGCWELPLGTTLREVIEEHAGGMCDGYNFRGVIPGGASTDFLVSEHYDMKLDYKTVQEANSRLGTATMIVLDDKTCPVGMVHNLEEFFAQESCGWCTPCRDGLPLVRNVLGALEDGSGREGDIELLEQHCRLLGPGNTFCALAPGAVEPLQSALKYFRKDFEKHIHDGGCPMN